jgi:enoyl-CoA hydratase
MAEYISTERDGAVAVVTIDNPPVNALKAALLEELEAELTTLDEESDARVIVIRGAGDRAFVAGADIKEFPALREAAGETGGSARGIQKVGLAIEGMRTPVIAAIHGFCLGGGLELAMACDIRVAAEDAQLGQPEIKLGLIPGGGGTQRLPRLVGRGRALYLNLTGDFISGGQAHEWGLVERVTPPGAHLDGALEIARTLAERSPHAMGVVKELATTTADLPLEDGLRREAEGFFRCLASEDGAEGVSAFIEKREPRWTGR